MFAHRAAGSLLLESPLSSVKAQRTRYAVQMAPAKLRPGRDGHRGRGEYMLRARLPVHQFTLRIHEEMSAHNLLRSGLHRWPPADTAAGARGRNGAMWMCPDS